MHCHQGNLKTTMISYPPLSSTTVCLQLSKKHACLHSCVDSKQRYLELCFSVLVRYVKTAEKKGKDLLLQIFGNPSPSFYNCIHFQRPKQISGFYQFGKKPSFKRAKLKLIGYTFQNLHSGWCLN